VNGEAARILAASKGGICATPGDVEGLANSILRVQGMGTEQRNAMGRNAREYVACYYDRVALADKYLEILRMVVDRKRKPTLTMGH
jgi:glycosyltransferase involved in cell wall biosynthesis